MRRKVAYFGVFVALALIFSYVEALIPIPLGIPGVKLGLANLMTVITLYKMGGKEAFVLSLLRITLSGFLFGSMFGIVYSFAGGLLSLCVMALLKQTQKFSIIGVSMAGGVSHNIGQLIMAIIVLESISIVYYVPVLIISGMLTGIIIGIISSETLKRIKRV